MPLPGVRAHDPYLKIEAYMWRVEEVSFVRV
jgi:hypothetical protein